MGFRLTVPSNAGMCQVQDMVAFDVFLICTGTDRDWNIKVFLNWMLLTFSSYLATSETA